MNDSNSSIDFPKKTRINRKGEFNSKNDLFNEWTKTKINFEINSKKDDKNKNKRFDKNYTK